ncbi:hypothetical protein Amsp01_094700 [Amycolatopsis sp. NBRC 101858]|uniref:anti-sigma factor n=1 Tax=Amycolatopsis sp. NBRC 101858 TaxID=3032200 RepID=UPI0024A25446|nr:anti-sigma factor [Amycolatopsis sp. NBRC 101858]GLY43447.1 hypothetical protein Amsp01_094700 [Amycolatopsis sp. NBRC 101858]
MVDTRLRDALMAPAELHTLAGAYALGAVTDEERAAFDRHLAGCAACAEDVRGFEETAARLGAAVGAVPVERLRSRVLAEITVTRQLPPQVGSPPVPVLPARRAWHRRAGAGVAAIAAGAALLVGGISIGMQNTPVSTQVASPANVRGAADAKTVHGDGTSGGAATATLSRGLGVITVDVRSLPPLEPGRAYQCWLVGPRGPQSAGLLHRGEGSMTAALPADTDRIAITTEPVAGSPQPTTSPVLLLGLA